MSLKLASNPMRLRARCPRSSESVNMFKSKGISPFICSIAFSFLFKSITCKSINMFLTTPLLLGMSRTGRLKTSDIRSESRTTVIMGLVPASYLDCANRIYKARHASLILKSSYSNVNANATCPFN